MTKKIPEYLVYFLEDCLGWDNSFSIKSMFWGYWIYKSGKIFWVYGFDEIYLKVWENNKKDYKHSNIFEYKVKWKIKTISYYVLSEEILENREELDKYIEKSLEVVSNTKVKKKSEKDIELDKNILKSLLDIPDWKVVTYKILWDKFWVHPRRVASIMKYNKNPEIYPCYKVVSHSLGVSGYSALDWVESKIDMLERDWVKIVNWKVLEEFVFSFE